MFSFSAGSLLLGLLFSGIGLVMLRLGKINADFPRILCGLALLIFPMLVGSLWWTLGLGVVLTAAPSAGEHFGIW